MGITETEWISSETEQYLWKYYFVASLIVGMKSFIHLFARIDRKYGPLTMFMLVSLDVQCAESDSRTWRETNINIVKMGYITIDSRK